MSENIQELEKRLAQVEKESKKSEVEFQFAQVLREYRGEDEVVSFKKYKELYKDLKFEGIKTGIKQLDELVEGFYEGDLVTITAPTGQGKTTFCQFLTCQFSKEKIRSLWFSYEVSVMNLISKFGDEIPDGYLPKVLLDRSLVWIERKIVESIAKYETKMVFIDHLHYLFNLATSKNVSLEIGEIMRSLKLLAKKYNIIIFIVAHTGKIGEDGIVGLDSIRDSSFVPQESDSVIALWRVRQKQRKIEIKENGIQYKNESVISVVKNRHNGKLGSFKKAYISNKFVDIDYEHAETNR